MCRVSAALQRARGSRHKPTLFRPSSLLIQTLFIFASTQGKGEGKTGLLARFLHEPVMRRFSGAWLFQLETSRVAHTHTHTHTTQRCG